MTQQYGNVNDTAGYTEAFYQAYKAGYEAVLQESLDVYAGATRVDALEGERKAYDFLGTIELSPKTDRFGDLPVEEIDHNRRWIEPSWFQKAVFVDDLDKVALHTDPKGDYITALAKAAIRKKNDVVYAAFDAKVQGGKDYVDGTSDYYSFNDTAIGSIASEGGRTIPHDATSGFAAGGTSGGLTIDKLILAREALTTLHNNPNQIFNLALSPRQLSDLHNEAVTQSLDTSPFRMLADGIIRPFHGFKFIVDYNITKGSSNDIDADTDIYPCWAFTDDAILFAQHASPMIKVDWIPRKQVWQISARIGFGAIRMDEDRVLKIECATV